jgi:hypothetical protein
MSKRVGIVIAAIAAVILGIQLVPTFSKQNPLESSPLMLPKEVAPILSESCFDCHSNRTVWPWYSYVAPLSWMVSHHAAEGREEVNFSTWGEMDAEKQTDALEEIWEEIAEGEMPLKAYLFVHRDASLSDDEVASIRVWLESQGVDTSLEADDERDDAEDDD